MSHAILRVAALVCAAFLESCSSTTTAAQDAGGGAGDRDAELARAIAEMRNLPLKLVDREAEERGPRIQAAWETLIAAKDAGVAALLAEAARLDAAKIRDDRSTASSRAPSSTPRARSGSLHRASPTRTTNGSKRDTCSRW